MKFTDGVKHKGKPFEIPDAPRSGLPQFFVEMGYKVGAEIGVYKGEFTEKFCKAGLTMYAIDPWAAYKGAGRTQQDQARQDFLYGHTQRLFAPYKDVAIIRKTSMDASKEFKVKSLDFVYIDGDHRFPSIANDIYAWYSKVKKGGAIAGHDYFCTSPGASNVICEVKPVVDAFVEAMGIENFYSFGRMIQSETRTKDDKYLSWMILK